MIWHYYLLHWCQLHCASGSLAEPNGLTGIEHRKVDTRALRSAGALGSFRSPLLLLPPQEIIPIEAVGHQPRLVPVEVLATHERAVLPRRRAESRAERAAELAGAAKAAASDDLL